MKLYIPVRRNALVIQSLFWHANIKVCFRLVWQKNYVTMILQFLHEYSKRFLEYLILFN